MDCPRFGKLFRGCRFEPRYDEPSIASLFSGFGSVKIDGNLASIEDTAPGKKYVRDVCIRCGKAVERAK